MVELEGKADADVSRVEVTEEVARSRAAADSARGRVGRVYVVAGRVGCGWLECDGEVEADDDSRRDDVRGLTGTNAGSTNSLIVNKGRKEKKETQQLDHL